MNGEQDRKTLIVSAVDVGDGRRLPSRSWLSHDVSRRRRFTSWAITVLLRASAQAAVVTFSNSRFSLIHRSRHPLGADHRGRHHHHLGRTDVHSAQLQ